MKFVELTIAVSGNPRILLNTDCIVTIGEVEKGTRIIISADDYVTVRETLDEIKNLIASE